MLALIPEPSVKIWISSLASWVRLIASSVSLSIVMLVRGVHLGEWRKALIPSTSFGWTELKMAAKWRRGDLWCLRRREASLISL